ncbi:tRNA (adenosine(37)-N6)-threonylcarbamoyltransferase complex dimerization subunit type 1 TsaB [Flavobacterium sediminis]|uniref:tRNA (Adenosine(37)-N6)-threonylcarbamoyltransferase complex dimerization subunit type 1 TsaB n=1 Tax=Flavobacterium sediminis TaxID=2201181 RepID=A0A2U8QVB8_9FLAO|nr:tRNA (adenosine(37)-N6)-threonylcarbamoyltransferase complex dimerization subunit type 1 TsaB [Flavobacterium sediminis]AWM13991.1 tRNA (adenosine(37)-N6)-threonylcarbamoyltransferase complex dimerization subunit type 1 TsaB [Flavobacterium sediminis]
MATILNIETATKNCSVSLAKDGKTIGIKEIATEQFSHAEKLHVFIEELLKETQLTFKDLDAVAVSKGPGSYTGLRIGVSTAKGLCYALDLPLISVDTLEILANALTVTSGVIVPMIDARRMEVFSAVFNTGKRKIRDTQAEIIDVDSYREISEDIHLIGDGAQKLQETLTASKFIYHPEIVYPSTQEMSFLSFEKYKKSDFEDVAYFEPYYLKDFVLNK